MTAFEQWYEQYDGGHGISEQSCRDGWNAALEEAVGVAQRWLNMQICNKEFSYELFCDLEKGHSGPHNAVGVQLIPMLRALKEKQP